MIKLVLFALCVIVGVLLTIRSESMQLSFVSPVPGPSTWRSFLPFVIRRPSTFASPVYLPIVEKGTD